MKRLTIFAAFIVASFGLLASFAGVAAADSVGPIDFESPAYSTGDINGQNGWLKTNPSFDVNVYLDGQLKKTGTTWEDYYRYDPEQSPSNSVPSIGKLLFREGGDATSADLATGFLVDGVALSSSPNCTQTNLLRDGLNLTA